MLGFQRKKNFKALFMMIQVHNQKSLAYIKLCKYLVYIFKQKIL